MKIIEKFYVLFILVAIISCKRGDQEYSTPRDLPGNTDQYSLFVLDNVFENELRFPSEYRIMNSEGNLVPLKSLLNTPKIVIRLHESYCESCIVEQIQIINSSLQHPQNTIIGLATYNNIRKFRILLSKYKIEFPVYFIPYNDTSQLFSAISKQDYLPFYFLIDTDLNSRYIFHPDTNFPKITMNYLKRSEVFLLEEQQFLHPLYIDKKDLSIDNALLDNTYDIALHYKNITSENVLIDSINVSCDCLQVISYDSSIKPKEEGKLVLKYKPANIGFDQQEINFVIKNHKNILVNFQAYVTD
ncbi:DUF1573 domain-containing protein [Proteiniphilum acetatigenes]|uniref:DUF1573 domain-containing protein n=1 Tax=Proteiniphilum acetatigenes TaxID=294710 RepID=UPI00036F2374|nr:DUF1573 domain-containing protein [Proteiniphilum acetatigenes]